MKATLIIIIIIIIIPNYLMLFELRHVLELQIIYFMIPPDIVATYIPTVAVMP